MSYKIKGPAIINVSGGRTSGYMLWHIVDAYDGKLPDDVVPLFCNTGVEHESCLLFLKQMAENWNVPITWLEYRYLPDGERKHSYVEVDYCSASRNGEPFDQLILAKGVMPNPITRFCTSELKIRTANRWCKDRGWDYWTRVVGLRADEPWRVAKIKGDVAAEDVECPLSPAGVDKKMVGDWWAKQDFDLKLPGNDDSYGNCIGCFLKGGAKIEKIARDHPHLLEWWAKQEERTDIAADGNGKVFRVDRPTYRQILTQVTVQGRLFDDSIDDDTRPCMCSD